MISGTISSYRNETLHSFSTAYGLPEYVKKFSEIWPMTSLLKRLAKFGPLRNQTNDISFER